MTRADTQTDDQERILDNNLRSVKQESFQMKRCLDKGRLMDGLKHASQMLSELRTNDLSPKYYYRLYIDVCDELQHLELHLIDEFTKGRKVADLYELVQYAGSIIPRLYLLITVGIVFIKSNEAACKDILKDLVEMCRGVQHPLHGLFLRNYLLQSTRNLLPDHPSEEQNDQGTVRDAIDFILTNFAEMNKLWVRMQHQGPSKEKTRRERERLELRILVGTNLVRLSQLENATFETYVNIVLPAILEQVVSCRDPIAQEYLMDCIIQVFVDEFHLRTLNTFLRACADLHAEVNIRNVLIALIDRVSSYVSSEGVVMPEGVHLFDIFSAQVEHITTSRPEMPPEDMVALQVSLLNLALKCYSDRIDYADKVLQSTSEVLAKLQINGIEHNKPLGKELTKLLRTPVDHFDSVAKLLELHNYEPAMSKFDYKGRTQTASYIAQRIVSSGTLFSQKDACESLLVLLSALVVPQPDQPSELHTDEDFNEEQVLLARLIPLFRSENLDQQYLILSQVRKQLGAGGSERIRYTLPSIVFAAFQLSRRYRQAAEQDENWLKKCQKIFQFCYQTISALSSESDDVEIPLRLFLQGVLFIADAADDSFESTAYEFFSQAFSLYEDSVSDSRAQFAAITLLAGTLEKVQCFGEENHEPLRTQAALAASKLFKKADKCRAVAMAANLFWSSSVKQPDGSVAELRDGVRVAECLRKAAKFASQCMEAAVKLQLYVELLQTSGYFHSKGCEQIDSKTIDELVGQIRECQETIQEGPVDSTLQQLNKFVDVAIDTVKQQVDSAK